MKAAQVLAWTAPLLQFAIGQNIPSNPSAADFLSRRHAAVTVLNDHLYIAGGLFSSLVDGKVAYHSDSNNKWQLNETLSLSLKESWTNSTVQLQVVEQKPAPSFSKAAFWRSPDQKSAYWWGGHVYTGGAAAKNLWQFTADSEGGGTWKLADTVNRDFLLEYPRTTGASTAVCKEKALYLGGFESPATGSSSNGNGRQPVSVLASYDMEKRTWDKASAVPGFNKFGTSIYGAGACADNFGSGGLFFSIGGNMADQDFKDNSSNLLISMDVLNFYDVASDTWHSQKTSGEVPPVRDRHCAVGVAGPNGTYEIYVYGGNDFRKSPEIIKNDMYVLSLPGFVWFRVDVESTYRTSHACIIPDNRQMIVIGGSAEAEGPDYEKKDALAQGLGVFDLHTLSWKDRYDANAGPYEPPQTVTDWYDEGNMKYVKWTDDKVKSLLLRTNNESNADPSKEPAEKESSTMDGPIFVGVLGGVLGAGVLAGVVWYLLRWRRRRRQQKEEERARGKPEPLLSSLSYASGDQSDGYDPNVSQNYQHYAIELEPGSPAKPQPVIIRGGHQEMPVTERAQEMVVTERAQEMVVTERAQELVVEDRPHELPAARYY